MFIATGTYKITRTTGDEVDEFDDPIDASDVVATHVLASVIEQTRTVFDPASSRLQTARKLTGRFRNGTDLLAGDRVTDESTGVVYVVDSVRTPNSAVNRADLVAELNLDTPGG